MSIDFVKALGVHSDALRLRAERTQVLASNIANESTPGYQARDIDFSASLRRAQSAGDGGGDGDGDSGGTGGLLLASDGPDALYRVPYHPSQDGNTVELGVEQAAFSQNTSDFQTSLTFLNITLRGMAKAIAGQ